MQRRTVFCTVVLLLMAGAALAQEPAPTPAPAAPAPQATPAPPPAEPAAQAAPAAPAPAAPAPAAAAPAAAAAAPAAAAAAAPAAAAAAPAAAAAAPAAQAAPAAAAPAAAAPPQAPAPVPTVAEVPRVYFEKAKVIVDGKADYNGALELDWKPLNGQAKLIQVNVLAKAKAKDIAADIYKELVLAAGTTYKVKLSGEKIEVKKANKQVPNFAIMITKLQVPGVSLRVEK